MPNLRETSKRCDRRDHSWDRAGENVVVMMKEAQVKGWREGGW